MDREAEQGRLRGVLQNHPELELAMLFGSVARGTATAESDLDIAVSAGSPLGVEDRILAARRDAWING